MSKKISGSEYPLKKIFSSDFEYVIPPYQRPYAWEEEQAEELFDDLFDFYEFEPEEGYFLGSIVLIKQDSESYAEVIDGQQRLTTLTILLSALASILGKEDQKELREYIWERGKKYERIEPKPRLTLREKDKEFFSKHVQELNFEKLKRLDEKSLDNESQKNIKKNSELFLKKIEENLGNEAENINKFVEFLVERCFLVAVSTPNDQSAYRVFSVMNDRGLDLKTTDIIKAHIIGELTPDERDEYNDRWEDMEVELDRDGFNDLFTYVRMIYAQEKAKKTLLVEFKEHVLSKVEPKELIEVLEPYADALATVCNANYEAVSYAEEVNAYLRWLNRIDNSDWIPVAILFLSRNKHVPEYVEWFFNRLERLAAYMHICALNVNERIKRYNNVIIEALKGKHSFNSPIQTVELNETEKEKMCEVLDGNIYELTAKRRNYLILRLDAFLSDGAASYNRSMLTIEHVLPQKVSDNTEWAKLWPDEQLRKQWVHRIANLVPLNRSRNSQAQNYDFAKKKSAYFSDREGVSSYVSTTQVLKCEKWTPEHLQNRQNELLKVLQENWRLSS
ncbi:MAG: DUF262 domain-containing HNH endonuclease family protein [Aestuariivita sp.]|nr:DUF262 domain-containing HNH endonuclease family protein [Aestuariivita sp.]